MKKKKRHVISDKLPVLAAIIFAAVGMLLTQTGAMTLSRILHGVMPFFSADTNPVVVVLIGALALFLYKLWYKPEYTGSVVYSEYKKAWVLIVAYILFLAFEVVELVIKHEPYKLTMNGFCIAVFAGVLEETVFRGLMIPVMMRKKKNIAVALFVSSGVFGLVHGGNLFAGADPGYTLVQVGSSFLVGVVFGGLYLMSGNILIPMAFHMLHDIVAVGVQSMVTENGVIKASVTPQALLEELPLVIVCTFVIIFIFLKKNREVIYSVWNKKWKDDSEQ